MIDSTTTPNMFIVFGDVTCPTEKAGPIRIVNLRMAFLKDRKLEKTRDFDCIKLVEVFDRPGWKCNDIHVTCQSIMLSELKLSIVSHRLRSSRELKLSASNKDLMNFLIGEEMVTESKFGEESGRKETIEEYPGITGAAGDEIAGEPSKSARS